MRSRHYLKNFLLCTVSLNGFCYIVIFELFSKLAFLYKLFNKALKVALNKQCLNDKFFLFFLLRWWSTHFKRKCDKLWKIWFKLIGNRVDIYVFPYYKCHASSSFFCIWSYILKSAWSPVALYLLVYDICTWSIESKDPDKTTSRYLLPHPSPYLIVNNKP